MNTKLVKLIEIYICCLGQIFIWRILDESNFGFLNFKTFKLVFKALDDLILESHEYTKFITNQDLQTLFMSSLHVRKF
jgi:hypothetical protein